MIRSSWFVSLVILHCLALMISAETVDVFPVMAWDSVPSDAAILKKMRECGFTIAGFMPPDALDACHAAGMKAIVSDARASDYDWANIDPAAARTRVAQLVQKVRNHPAVYGYYLRDEPSASMFPGLATVSGAVKELHPGAWPYINLFPNYASAVQLGTATYEEHVEQFVKTCQPTVLSYDHYAIMEGGSLRGEYFANLETIRRAALRHNIPFWQIVLSVGCLSYREPSPVDLSFEVYTSLAYGARGVAYFKYFTPAVGNFRGGPIDHFGHANPSWRAVQQLNLQLAKLGPTLLKLRSDRVYHFGEVPAGCSGPDEHSLVEVVTGPVLVGDFTHDDGSRYAMIVNKSFTNSLVCVPKFRPTTTHVEFVSPYVGTLGSYEGEQAWLAPGQGVLLKLTPLEKK